MTLEELFKLNDYIYKGYSVPPYCCESEDDKRNKLYKDWVESNIIKKEPTMPKVVDYKEEKKND